MWWGWYHWRTRLLPVAIAATCWVVLVAKERSHIVLCNEKNTHSMLLSKIAALKSVLPTVCVQCCCACSAYHSITINIRSRLQTSLHAPKQGRCVLMPVYWAQWGVAQQHTALNSTINNSFSLD